MSGLQHPAVYSFIRYLFATKICQNTSKVIEKIKQKEHLKMHFFFFAKSVKNMNDLRARKDDDICNKWFSYACSWLCKYSTKSEQKTPLMQ